MNNYRIPSTGKPMYQDHLQGASLSHDHNNLIRLYEILLANSFGNKDYVKNKYQQEQKPPAPQISANLFANIHQKQQNEFAIRHQPVFYGNPYVPNYPPPPTFHPHGPSNVIRRPIPTYPTAINCPTCGKSFYSQLYLEVHQLLHLSKQHQEFVCNICNEIFPTSTKLDIHKRLHEGLEPLKLCNSPKDNENILKSQESPKLLELLKKSLSPCDSLKNEESLKYEESAKTVVEIPSIPLNSPKDGGNIFKSEEAAQTTLEIPSMSPILLDSPKEGETIIKSEEAAQTTLEMPSIPPILLDSPKEGETIIIKSEEAAQTTLEMPSIPPILPDSPKDDENIIKSEEAAQTTLEKPSTLCDSLENKENSSKSEVTVEMNGKMPFKCPICDKVFKHYLRMKRHASVHERCNQDEMNEKISFKCPICDKVFKHYLRLKRHASVHERCNQDEMNGKIPFKCPICDKVFKHGTSFKRHAWVHERCAQDRFRCAQCNKSYTWKYNLEVHIKKTHQ